MESNLNQETIQNQNEEKPILEAETPVVLEQEEAVVEEDKTTEEEIDSEELDLPETPDFSIFSGIREKLAEEGVDLEAFDNKLVDPGYKFQAEDADLIHNHVNEMLGATVPKEVILSYLKNAKSDFQLAQQKAIAYIDNVAGKPIQELVNEATTQGYPQEKLDTFLGVSLDPEGLKQVTQGIKEIQNFLAQKTVGKPEDLTPKLDYVAGSTNQSGDKKIQQKEQYDKQMQEETTANEEAVILEQQKLESEVFSGPFGYLKDATSDMQKTTICAALNSTTHREAAKKAAKVFCPHLL